MARTTGTRSRGRGTAAAFGFLLLLAGLIGAGALFFMATQRPADAVDGFARAVAGCTTTLEFADTGTYYVYEESGSGEFEPTDGCTPVSTPGTPFMVVISGPAGVSVVDDASVTYDLADFTGTSVQRLEVTEPGLYEIQVMSADPESVAAVGRDPEEGVDELRRGAVLVAAVGVLLGLLLLVLSGRRSHRAATPSIPDGPGWGPKPPPPGEWPPAAPTVARVPINPTQPDTPAVFTPPPPPLPSRAPGAGLAAPSWGPPGAGQQPVSAEAPSPPPPPRTPQPQPVLPDVPPPPPPPRDGA